MSYYLPWTLLIIASLWASLAGFLWALNRGQFSDQERARYLPLRGESFSGAKNPGGVNREIYALLAVLGLGGLMMILVLLVILTH